MDIVLVTNEVWLVCGGRGFSDRAMFDDAMHDLIRLRGGCPAKVVHGAASGADTMANDFGKKMAIEIAACPADWMAYGKAAGPIRNAEMLQRHKPTLVVAFPGGHGTADMVRRARAARIPVAEIKSISEAS